MPVDQGDPLPQEHATQETEGAEDGRQGDLRVKRKSRYVVDLTQHILNSSQYIHAAAEGALYFLFVSPALVELVKPDLAAAKSCCPGKEVTIIP